MPKRAFHALLLCLLAMSPAVAGPVEPVVCPVVRYGWPEKLSAGMAIQPPLPGRWGALLGSVEVGRGGLEAGVGVGSFGGDLMAGAGIQLTVLHTGANPLGAAPHQTFLGMEAEVMFGAISFKAGPAVRVSGPSPDRFRMNVGVGYGF